MAGIGDMVVTLGVNSKPFSGGLVSARSALSSFAGGITSGFSTVAGGIGLIGGALGPIALGLAGVAGAVKAISDVKSAFDDIDRIAKSADSFGLTTEDMVGLEHAANLSGVSTELLGKAMQKATRNGTDLGTIADKIAAAETPTEKARIAFDNLGRSGQDLLPLLNEGGEAIRGMMAEGAGLAGFSREDAGKIEAANDAISTMQLAFTGVARDIAISLAPTIERVAVGVKTLGMWTRDAFTHITPIIEQTGNVAVAAWDVASTTFMTLFGGIVGTAQATFADVTAFVLDAAVTAEFALQNLGPIADLAWLSVQFGALKFYEDTKHLFEVGLPTVVMWFGKEFNNILFTAVSYAGTIFMNLTSNIRGLWSELLGFFSGEPFEFNWRPLTQGALNAISSLPDIPERILTDAEASLAGQISTMTAGLTKDMAGFKEQRIAELTGDGTTTKPGSFIGDIESSNGLKQDVKGPGALQSGSKEAFSAIFGAMRNNKPNADVVAELKQTRELMKRDREELKRLQRAFEKGQVEIVAVSP